MRKVKCQVASGHRTKKQTESTSVKTLLKEWLGSPHTTGTLNVHAKNMEEMAKWERVRAFPWKQVEMKEENGSVHPWRLLFYQAELPNYGRAVVVTYWWPGYPGRLLEILAPHNLREELNLVDGDEIEVLFPENRV